MKQNRLKNISILPALYLENSTFQEVWNNFWINLIIFRSDIYCERNVVSVIFRYPLGAELKIKKFQNRRIRLISFLSYKHLQSSFHK